MPHFPGHNQNIPKMFGDLVSNVQGVLGWPFRGIEGPDLTIGSPEVATFGGGRLMGRMGPTEQEIEDILNVVGWTPDVLSSPNLFGGASINVSDVVDLVKNVVGWTPDLTDLPFGLEGGAGGPLRIVSRQTEDDIRAAAEAQAILSSELTAEYEGSGIDPLRTIVSPAQQSRIPMVDRAPTQPVTPYDVYTDEELERFWDLEDEFDYADRVQPFAGDVGSMQLLEQRIAAEPRTGITGARPLPRAEDPSIYWDLETAEDAGFVVTPEDLIAEGFSPEDDLKSIELLEQRIAAEEEERRRAGVVPEQPGIGGPPPVPSGLADAARADAFAGLTDYEDWLEPYGRPAHEYWEGVTAQLDPFWQVRAPAAELGRRLQSRYLLEYPEMSVDPSGVSPTFGQYFQDWRPYAAGGFAEGTAPSYYSDPTQLLARARQAGLAGITEPGKFAESYQYGDPDFLRAAWLSSQFGPGVQGAAANQRAVASLLALQRPTGGAYGGQMANAIRNAVFNVQQRRKALGADPGSFLHWFANPEARSSPALMAPNIGPEWRQALKNPVSPIGL